MHDIINIAKQNQAKAWRIIRELDIVNTWESAGAEIHLVGSLKTGLLMKHLDIDFHIYSFPLNLSNSFKVIAQFAENTSVKHIEYLNRIDTEEKCIEWHLWYQDTELWQIDMIHILKGSFYDGYFENVAERISTVLTSEAKHAILSIKNDIPKTDKVMGINIYQAVIQDGIRNYNEFKEWEKKHQVPGINNWLPELPKQCNEGIEIRDIQ